MSQYTKEQLDYICRTAARQFAKDNESVIQEVMPCRSFHTNVYVRAYRLGDEKCTETVPQNYTFVTATAIFMSDFVQTSVYATCFIPDDCTYDSSFKSVAYHMYEEWYEDLCVIDAVRTQRRRRQWRKLNQTRSLDEYNVDMPVLANDPLDELRFFEPAFDVYESIEEAFQADPNVTGIDDEV
jgi:hypothetical protein